MNFIRRRRAARTAQTPLTATCLVFSLLMAGAARAQGPDAKPTDNPPRLSATELQSRLAPQNAPTKADGDALAGRVRAWFGADKLRGGMAQVKTDETLATWAIETPAPLAPGVVPVIVGQDGAFSLPLRRLGESNVYANVTRLADGAGFAWSCQVGNETRGGGQIEAYQTPPENKPNPLVPKGVLTEREPWKSAVFANTVRNWWVYVPAQYTPDKPACLMVFQDGGGYKGYIPTVFDNLIAKGDMPVTVAVFIDPGKKLDEKSSSNRSFEYDTLSDQYARLLIEEMLPEVEKTVSLRHDPASRAIAGGSSGGICAFTAAWEHPEQFGKVMSWIGSFVNLQGGPSGIGGGHNYPPLIRKTKGSPKPIRVFLQDGANDLDNPFGNWPLANQGMAKALAYAGYDYKFVLGNGFHSGKHGQAILPDTLRWLWRDVR